MFLNLENIFPRSKNETTPAASLTYIEEGIGKSTGASNDT